MSAPDPQLARAEIIMASARPQPEPTEAEVCRVLEHLTVTTEATPTAEKLEAGR